MLGLHLFAEFVGGVFGGGNAADGIGSFVYSGAVRGARCSRDMSNTSWILTTIDILALLDAIIRSISAHLY